MKEQIQEFLYEQIIAAPIRFGFVLGASAIGVVVLLVLVWRIYG